jgi:phosphoribosylformylglycinamidine synthase
MSQKVAVLVFPGSNCDQDCVRSFERVTGLKPDLVWHKESRIPDYDLIIIPGGFSFGDYLRSGAIARFSPVMSEVIRHVERGAYVIGICNGFQILTEARLLPGALLRNRDIKYICKEVFIRVENDKTAFTRDYRQGEVIRVPISHGDGNYNLSEDEYNRLLDEDRVIFRYCEKEGEINPDSAPNGSKDNIAGVMNDKGNILGLMPHPERVTDPLLGGVGGKRVWLSVFKLLKKGSPVCEE